MYQFLHLTLRLNLADGRIVEREAQSLAGGIVDRAAEGGEGVTELVADKDGKSALVPVIFRFETDLDLLVFVQDAFVGIGKTFEPLDISRISVRLTFSIFGATVRGATRTGSTPPSVAVSGVNSPSGPLSSIGLCTIPPPFPFKSGSSCAAVVAPRSRSAKLDMISDSDRPFAAGPIISSTSVSFLSGSLLSTGSLLSIAAGAAAAALGPAGWARETTGAAASPLDPFESCVP